MLRKAAPPQRSPLPHIHTSDRREGAKENPFLGLQACLQCMTTQVAQQFSTSIGFFFLVYVCACVYLSFILHHPHLVFFFFFLKIAGLNEQSSLTG